ncbi:hypothetical protein [Micrococcoides hystricis]|uniref:Uncharacterized protein n=1 Tax=Micrococcoides hystricis TaxID=1572761 RepID=A0ABV6PBG7_9MICC
MNFRECAAELLAARQDFGIDGSLHTIQVVANRLQQQFGFAELPLTNAPISLFEADPDVRADRVSKVLSLVDARAVQELLDEAVRERVRQHFSVSLINSFGPTKRWFGLQERRKAFAERVAQEHEDGRRITVVFEDDPSETFGFANFQVYGHSQYLREYIWALTGIMPTTIGSPANEHYRRCAQEDGD